MWHFKETTLCNSVTLSLGITTPQICYYTKQKTHGNSGVEMGLRIKIGFSL